MLLKYVPCCKNWQCQSEKSDLGKISHPNTAQPFSSLPLGWGYWAEGDITQFKVSRRTSRPRLTARFWDMLAVPPFWHWTLWKVLHGEASKRTGDHVCVFCAGYFTQSQSHLSWCSCTRSRPSFFPLLHHPIFPGSRSRRTGCYQARRCFWTHLLCIQCASSAVQPLLRMGSPRWSAAFADSVTAEHRLLSCLHRPDSLCIAAEAVQEQW